MSQVTHSQPQAFCLTVPTAIYAAVATLIAAAAVVFVLFVFDGDDTAQTSNPAISDAPPGVRYDGGPEEGSRGR